MKSLSIGKLITPLAIILLLPTVYFIIISVLKYTFGIASPYDASEPLLNSFGLKESLGWNINLIILFGPIAALLLTIFQILKIGIYTSEEKFEVTISTGKKWLPILIAAASITVMGLLAIYFLGENCSY
jgi:hypothetical protein